MKNDNLVFGIHAIKQLLETQPELVVEIFTPEGDTITEKLTCVVAGQLD